MKCPHCHHEIGTSVVDLANNALLLQTRCEKCGKEFLILEGVPMTEEQYSSHILR
jgi:transcriptional regulator NrdR family protein